MSYSATTIVWLRRDFRLSDNAALTAAAARGAVIPVFILDPQVGALGAAPQMRLDQALSAFQETLKSLGMRLILRRGQAEQVLPKLVQETGADAVFWNRRYDAPSVACDTNLKADLGTRGVKAKSFAGTLLFEPWTVATGQGGPYRVYTPFWKAVRDRVVSQPLARPSLVAPSAWPQSETSADWDLSRRMQGGARVVAQYMQAGEDAAMNKLTTFIDERVAAYRDKRDFMGSAATSELSDALSLGEISPAQCWHAGWRAKESGAPGAEHFLKELTWREFAWHLMWHFPSLDTQTWRPEWARFSWIENPEDVNYLRWCQGRTGVTLVDAAMRELYVTGKMHNRARMIAASYLTKHLGVHWRLGRRWFEECLIDWDAASNAMGWQWVAGCGPDASPYFRIFNPDTQAAKFDPDEAYRKRWLAEPYNVPSSTALEFFAAAPNHWNLKPDAPYGPPIVGLKEGRQQALSAYETFKLQ
ncbi:deoxyribodipyrimidine photo-lyase [Shimia sp.]|uniref:cryptochrome/photolyase family protein n=1 Tax=Shimia sp. TaxID=1954381 RepID=UPI0032998D95